MRWLYGVNFGLRQWVLKQKKKTRSETGENHVKETLYNIIEKREMVERH